MDLKTFAVHRKLQFDDNLLSYVVRNMDIPISVVEESFRDYMGPLIDKQSEMLVLDYPRMLHENVPIVTSLNEETGGYDVSGNIPDNLVEAVQLVHDVDTDTIVEALVGYNLSKVHKQDYGSLILDVKASAERTLMNMGSIPAVVPVKRELDTELVEQGAAISATQPIGGETFLPDMQNDMQASLTDDVPNDIQASPEIEDILNAASNDMQAFPIDGEDDMSNDIQASFTSSEDGVPDDMQASLTDGEDDVPNDMGITNETEEPAAQAETADTLKADAYEPEFKDESEQKTFTQAIQNIYTKFLADIKSYGLDKRLNLRLA